MVPSIARLIAFFPYRMATIIGTIETVIDPEVFWSMYKEIIPTAQKSNHAVYVLRDNVDKLHGFFVHDDTVKHYKDNFEIKVKYW